MARLFLGIDGGGSKCRARIRDEAGRLLGEGEGGPANIYQDFSGSVRSITDAATAAIAAAGLSPGAAADLYAGLGIAGIETLPQRQSALSVLPFAAVTAINDAPAACLGAHGGADGGIVIAGTGSAGCAMVGGKTTIIGGRGFELGDDGSGAIMGREAVRAAVLALDGLGPRTPFTERVLDMLGRDQQGLAAWAKAARPGDYARFVPEIFAFGSRGDPVANGIVGKAMRDIRTIVARLLELGASKVALVGGLSRAMSEDFSDLARPQADAMDGAIMAARSAAGLPMVPK